MIIIGLIILFIPRIVLFFNPREKIMVNAYQLQKLRKNYAWKKTYFSRKSSYFKSRYKIPPKKFNPNEYTEKEWMNLGLSKKQVAVIFKYTKRGIYSNDQLEKIVVISKQLFALIKDSTFYPERKNYTSSFEVKTFEKEK